MSTGGTDLSRQSGVVLTAFSFVTGQAPSLALDGATNTFYESKGTVLGEWLNLDLGTDVPLSSINYFEHVNIASSLRDDSVRCYMVHWRDSQGKTLQINLYKTVNATYQFKAGSPDYPPTAPSPGAHPCLDLRAIKTERPHGCGAPGRPPWLERKPSLALSPAGFVGVAMEEGGLEPQMTGCHCVRVPALPRAGPWQMRLAATALEQCARCSKPVLADLRSPAC
jgi:hypothetical protein